MGAVQDRLSAEIDLGQGLSARHGKARARLSAVQEGSFLHGRAGGAAFGCHRNTVRNWQRQGLEPIDDKRPIVFEGAALAAFLEARRNKRRRRLSPGEMCCAPCRAAKEPAGDIADYLPLTETRGNLRGICPTCGRLIHRFVSRAKSSCFAENWT